MYLFLSFGGFFEMACFAFSLVYHVVLSSLHSTMLLLVWMKKIRHVLPYPCLSSSLFPLTAGFFFLIAYSSPSDCH